MHTQVKSKIAIYYYSPVGVTMKIRTLRREEIEKVRGIDRSEIITQDYYLRGGLLTLKDVFYDIKGWDPSELEKSLEHLYDIYDRNGALFGAYDRDKLIAVSALESAFIGRNQDQLQLYFHHVDSRYRHKGIGGELLIKVIAKAKKFGAKKLYISATPSKNTIDFYIHMGCRLTPDINSTLYRLEPEDIHLELEL